MTPNPRFRPLALLAATMLLSAVTATAQETPEFDPKAEAQEVVDLLGESRFTEVEAKYSEQMAAALPAGQLAVAWGQLTAQVGALKTLGEPEVREQNGVTIVTFPAEYESAQLNLIVAWDGERKLAGLLAQPAG